MRERQTWQGMQSMSASKPTEIGDIQTNVVDLPPMVVLTPEESWAFFDEESRRIAGVGLEEFIRRVESGEYRDIADEPENWDLIFLVQAVARG
jgi:hypothetical protein